MKKILSFLLLIGVSFLALTGCSLVKKPVESEKLSTPVIYLDENIATWNLVRNAIKYEINLDGKQWQVDKTCYSYKLKDGETIKVRAIGDEVNYTASDWSNTVTYIAPEVETEIEKSEEHTCDFNGAWLKDDTYHWHKCSCGEIDTKVAHSGGKATCVSKAVCSDCGQLYGNFGSHDLGLWIDEVDATCISTGLKGHFECRLCYKNIANDMTTVIEDLVIPATNNHIFDIVQYTDELHWYECSCGTTKKDSFEKHKGGVATETSKAICEVCNEEYGEYKKHQHDFDSKWESDETNHWHECSCGEYDSKIAHENSEAVKENEVASTCKVAGSYESVVYCNVCERELSRTKYDLPLEEHNFVDGVCDVCGETKEEEYLEVTIPEALNLPDESKVCVSGTVAAINTVWNNNNISVTIVDGQGNSLYIYKMITNVSLGDIITVKGSMGTYTGRQIAEGSIAVITGHVSDYDYKEMTILEAIASPDNTNIIVVGTVDEILVEYSESYGNICVYINDGQGNRLYLYRLNGNVTVGQTIKVKGTMGTYNDQRQVTGATFELVEDSGNDTPNPDNPEVIKLDKPVVTVSEEGLVSWNAVLNAASYIYIINGGAEISTTELSVQLEDGDSIVVKAVGDGTNYLDSAYSLSLTYVALKPTTFTISYNTNGYGNEPDALTNVVALPLELPVLESDELEFVGWYLDESLTKPAIPGASITADTILYAKWDNIAEPELTTGEKIQAEYNALIAGTTTAHTTWDFTATVVDMTATSYNSNYGSYNLKFIADIDGVLIGIYNGQVNGVYPTNIDGFGVGIKVRIVGTIAEAYTMTSGSYTVNIEFSRPEVSWSTTDEEDEEEYASKVNFFSINDTHGAFLDSSAGSSIGRVDSLLDSITTSNGEYIKIHVGDAFQGSYVSGQKYGLPLIEALNTMEFDAFVLGNHEFDWGIDKIAQYADGDLTNGEANFPFLGANIYYQNTTTNPDWIKPYTIVEYDGIKVGIIGVMGPGQESSILTRYVKDYYFAQPVNIVSNYAKELRTKQGCSVVVVATHDYDTTINNNMAKLTGENRIDAIFCAHTHELINEKITRTDGVQIPVVQNNHKNVKGTGVTIYLDSENDMISADSTIYTPSNYDISSDIQMIINKYQYLIDESNEVLGSTSSSISKSTLGAYATDAMLDWSYNESNFEGIDVSIINTGGVRATIDSGDITRADVFEVFPFNNAVVLVNMSGKLIKSLYSSNKDYLYIDVVDSIGSYSNLNDNTIYQLAVIDYVFEGSYYSEFKTLTSNDYLQTDIIMRDILLEYIDNKY